MLDAILANLIADVIWLPAGWLILRFARRLLRDWREEFAAATANQTAEFKDVTARQTEEIKAHVGPHADS
jgi:hypothetical protein